MNHIEIRHQIDVSLRAQQAEQLSLAALRFSFNGWSVQKGREIGKNSILKDSLIMCAQLKRDLSNIMAPAKWTSSKERVNSIPHHYIINGMHRFRKINWEMKTIIIIPIRGFSFQYYLPIYWIYSKFKYSRQLLDLSYGINMVLKNSFFFEKTLHADSAQVLHYYFVPFNNSHYYCKLDFHQLLI